ncbi:hypothetical protein GmRootA79_46900 [Acidovorax sp. A79]|uniref:helix-turn-helix transcriptional regulator n=1 Tax=Acidovorax sp. A79 TaxID=3056107 RepID=UPI0034E8B0AC
MSDKAIFFPPKGSSSDAPPQLAIRRKQLAHMLGISRSMTYLKENPDSRYFDDRFPESIRLGARMRCFLMSDVNKYLENLAEKDRTS